MGCCCTNFFIARNILRYQYRIRAYSKSSDEVEECFWPCFVFGCAALVGNCIPCIWFGVCAGYVYFNVQMQKEADERRDKRVRKGYLVGFVEEDFKFERSFPTSPMHDGNNDDVEDECGDVELIEGD